MAKVDPFVIRWPKKWAEDPDLRDVLRYLNRFLHDLWIRTGGGEDFIDDGAEAIEDNETNIGKKVTLSRLFDIEERLGSGMPVTIDTTGFTVDTTEQTTDMTEV